MIKQYTCVDPAPDISFGSPGRDLTLSRMGPRVGRAWHLLSTNITQQVSRESQGKGSLPLYNPVKSGSIQCCGTNLMRNPKIPKDAKGYFCNHIHLPSHRNNLALGFLALATLTFWSSIYSISAVL